MNLGGSRWGLMPIERPPQLPDDRVMAQRPFTPASGATADRDPEAAVGLVARRNEESLDSLAGRLAEVAHAVRRAAGRPREVNDVAGAVASITSALGDLAVAAELTANAVIDADRPGLASRTAMAPSLGARAVSWRLHTLASELRAARDACEAVRVASGHPHGAIAGR
jgi:hypothetical protein